MPSLNHSGDAVFYEVVVIGGGPTGLMVAADLAAAGVRVALAERRRHSDPNVTRAFGVHAATLEQLDIRGIAEDLISTGNRVQRVRLFDAVRVDLARLPSRFNYLLITPQSQTEKVLRDRAMAAGVEFLSGLEVMTLTQDDHEVLTRARREDGSTVDLRSRYAVGADGVGSTVRRHIGVDFPGKSVLKSIMLADVRMTDPPRQRLAMTAVGEGFTVVVPFGDGWYRVIAWRRGSQAEPNEPVQLDEVRWVAELTLGTDHGMHSPRWLSRFHSDERLAAAYRVGRVFLAGDAAHVHSPAGGLGMNAAIQDAANLGWKLGAVLRGRAAESLLDTYQAERRPVGSQVIRTSGALLRMATMKSPLGRTARNMLGRLVASVPAAADHAAGTVSGLSLRYKPPKGADRRVGRRAAALSLADRRMHQVLASGDFAVVSTEEPDGLPRHVRWVQPEAQVNESAQIDEPVLVRPDGYIGWIGDLSDYPFWA